MCAECPVGVINLALEIRAYLAAHDYVIVGGLHIVLEDENVESHHITWCRDTQQLDDKSRHFAYELLNMPVPSRHMAIQMAHETDRFWEDLLEEIENERAPETG